MDVVGEESTVICLANDGDDVAPKVDPKLGVLGNINLVIVGQFVEPVAVDAPCSTPRLSRMGPMRALFHSQKVNLFPSLLFR